MSSTEYTESGSGWWPVLWGPGFAALGVVIEWRTPGPAHPWSWVPIAVLLAALAALWVHGKRRLFSVRVTASSLVVGGEELPLSRISAVGEAAVPVGSRVLGGGAAAPKGTGELPLLLDDGRVVIAWAKDPTALERVLRMRLGQP